ncbi:hypothetical protein FDECE_18430 [Fusarium decemcellulare]|nr:hypothetical protein FDECE_18430 [Fusarium decemcellulare]
MATTSHIQEHPKQSSHNGFTYHPHAPPYQKYPGNGGGRAELSEDTVSSLNDQSSSFESPTEISRPNHHCEPYGGVGQFEPNRRLQRFAQRSVQLVNLAAGVTHGNIAAAVRGGMILDIYLRAKEHTATVSFAYEEDAAAFLDHSREHGLYVKNSQALVKWSDQQFILAGHVAYTIGKGATRNLIIRRRDPNHTEQSIRTDLDHIHNLHVIKVEFLKDDCFISMNSVHNAIVARTCLMSRVEYKGSRFEWATDECAQPLRSPPIRKETQTPTTRLKPKSEPVSAPSMSTSFMANRFQLLDLTDNDDDDSYESD